MSRAFREPASVNTFALLEELKDWPETWEGNHAESGGENQTWREKRACDKAQSGEQESPPALCSVVVFSFYDNGMKNSDAEERCSSYDYSCEIHFIRLIFGCKNNHYYDNLLIFHYFFS